jgi:hypothetical protein
VRLLIGPLIRRGRAVTFFAVLIFKGAQEGFAVLLDQKATKKSRQKKASPHRHLPLARFSVWPTLVHYLSSNPVNLIIRLIPV